MPNEYMQPFFDSLSQGVQVAQHLTNAALQMRQLQQERQAAQARQDLSEREFQSQQQQSLGQQLANGAKPVDSTGNVQMPTPAAANPNFGMPGQGDQPLSLPQSGSSPVPADPTRNYSVAGQTLQAPTLQDQLERTIANKRAIEDADRIPISDKLADAAGLPRGSKVSPEHLAGLGAMAHWLNPPQQDNTPSVLHTQVIGDDKGNQTLVNQLSDGTVKETPLKAKGKSDKFGNPEAAAASINAKTMTDNQLRQASEQALKDYQKGVHEESDINKENGFLSSALKSNGKLYVNSQGKLRTFTQDRIDDPDEQKSLQDEMQARLQSNMQRLPQVISDKQGAQNRYADASGNNGARPTTAKPGVSGTPAAAKAASTGAKPLKTATMQNVAAYAKQKGITPDSAKQEFLSAGYQVQ